jgi:hypothetical protein
MPGRMIRIAYYRPPYPGEWGYARRVDQVRAHLTRVMRDEFGDDVRVLVLCLEDGPPCLRPFRASGDWEGYGLQAEEIARAALKDALDASWAKEQTKRAARKSARAARAPS